MTNLGLFHWAVRRTLHLIITGSLSPPRGQNRIFGPIPTDTCQQTAGGLVLFLSSLKSGPRSGSKSPPPAVSSRKNKGSDLPANCHAGRIPVSPGASPPESACFTFSPSHRSTDPLRAGEDRGKSYVHRGPKRTAEAPIPNVKICMGVQWTSVLVLTNVGGFRRKHSQMCIDFDIKRLRCLGGPSRSPSERRSTKRRFSSECDLVD